MYIYIQDYVQNFLLNENLDPLLHLSCFIYWLLKHVCEQGGSGSANNIKFQNVEMQNVKNPIIIDQNYCDQDGPCKQQVKQLTTLRQNTFYFQLII